MVYEWSQAGVQRAVETAMRDHPELAQPFCVAESRDPRDYSWHVELDPTRKRRVARLTWQMIADPQLEAIAEALEVAALA